MAAVGQEVKLGGTKTLGCEIMVEERSPDRPLVEGPQRQLKSREDEERIEVTGTALSASSA